MTMRTLAAATAAACIAATAAAQTHAPHLEGTWKAKTPDGPRTIVVRSDSSASFGDQTVRWRVVADSIFIALGDEWTVYNYVVSGRRLTLSGGDLTDPVALERVGPPTPRPDSIPIPPAPPMNRRAATEPGQP
ncbi:MAG TPA: hypothetical protein VJ992_02400 [Gemmatimonadales bacterium]|nr:hypothetical protein [Gemmatimonadales bacterium]